MNIVAAVAGTLASPAGVTVDNAGNIFIADAGHNRILKVAVGTGTVTTVAGTGLIENVIYNGDNIPATSVNLNNPGCVAFDRFGNMYIADRGNRRVRKMTTDGIIHNWAGNGLKTGEIHTDGSLATDVMVAFPTGLVFDSIDNLYIADNRNHVVRMVDPEGVIHTYAGDGTAGWSGDDSAAIAAQLSGPDGLALDSARNLYISDSFNHTIRKVTYLSTPMFTMSTVAGFNTDVGTDPGDGGPASAAYLNNPKGLALDGAGNLYIADSGNNRVRKITIETGLINTVAGGGANADGGPATAGKLTTPTAVALDSSGNLFISDANQLRKVTESILPMVTASSLGGSFPAAQTVTLSASKPSTIHYTTDLSTPTVSSSSFATTGQIIIDFSKTLKYYAVDSDGNQSDVASLSFAILPGAPTGVSATAGTAQATVLFTAPTFTGGSTISSYTVTSNPGNITASGSASPITVTGLNYGTAYTFTVTATNAIPQIGVASVASNSVTPVAPYYNLTLSLAGTGGGTVNDGSSCSSGGTCPPFLSGTVVTLMASPDSNSLLGGWSSACTVTANNNCNVTMNASKTVTATFNAVSKLKIEGGGAYDLLSGATTAAGNNAVILARSVLFDDGAWIVNRPSVNIFFVGGYDTSFKPTTGDTALKGGLKIQSGTLRVDGLALR
jgi:sugar lactone lactonase YvrE